MVRARRGGRVTLEQLQALAAVGRAGSVAEAARRSRTPRTTLTRRIAELEAHVGAALLQRTPTGVTLTDLGRRLADRGQVLIDEVRDLGATFRDETTAGTLRVAYPCGVHPRLLTAACRALFDALPQVSFLAMPGPHVGAPGDADVWMAFSERPPSGPYLARSIARVPVRLLAGRRWLEAHGAPATVDAVVERPLLYWSTEPDAPALPLLAGGHVPVRPRLVTPDLHFLHQAARDGLGLVWAIDGGIGEDDGVEALTPVLAETVGASTKVWVLFAESSRAAPRVQEAVRHLMALTELSSTSG